MNENEICRACLNKHEQFFNIFTHYTYEKLISDTLTEYTSIEIKENDELPANICQMCMEKLNSFNYFKSMVIESDRVLRSSNYKLIDNYIDNSNNYNVPDYIKEESNLEHVGVDNILNNEAEKANIELLENIESTLCSKFTDSNEFVENETKLKKSKRNNEGYYCKPCKKSYKTFKGYEIHCNNHEIIKLNYKKTKNDDYNIPIQNNVKIKFEDINDEDDPNENDVKSDVCLSEQKEMIKSEEIKEDKKARNYCVECDKSFRTTYRFKIHNSKHNGIKPFKCKDCHKCFAQQCVLNVHSRVHTGMLEF